MFITCEHTCAFMFLAFKHIYSHTCIHIYFNLHKRNPQVKPLWFKNWNLLMTYIWIDIYIYKHVTKKFHIYVFIYILIEIHMIPIGEVSLIQELKFMNDNLKWRLQQRNRSLLASQGTLMHLHKFIYLIYYVNLIIFYFYSS